jgi:hypothetical protein
MEFDKVSITTPNVIHPFADYAFLNVAIPDMHISLFSIRNVTIRFILVHFIIRLILSIIKHLSNKFGQLLNNVKLQILKVKTVSGFTGEIILQRVTATRNCPGLKRSVDSVLSVM